MLRSRHLLLPTLLAAPLFGQEVDLRVVQAKDQVLRFTIESQSKTATEREMLVDGEEPDFGGRGGGGRGGFGGFGGGGGFSGGGASGGW